MKCLEFTSFCTVCGGAQSNISSSQLHLPQTCCYTTLEKGQECFPWDDISSYAVRDSGMLSQVLFLESIPHQVAVQDVQTPKNLALSTGWSHFLSSGCRCFWKVLKSSTRLLYVPLATGFRILRIHSNDSISLIGANPHQIFQFRNDNERNSVGNTTILIPQKAIHWTTAMTTFCMSWRLYSAEIARQES